VLLLREEEERASILAEPFRVSQNQSFRIRVKIHGLAEAIHTKSRLT